MEMEVMYMALDLNKLVSTAAKVAVGAAEIGKEVIGGVVSGVKEGIASEKSERAAEEANAPKDTRCEELIEKLPFLKASEAKVTEAFFAHPERKMIWFCLPDSVTEGVIFHDSEGNEAYAIRKDSGNIRKVELFQGETSAGSIEKVITISISSPVGLQKYAVSLHGEKPGTITVEGLNVKPDYASWSMKHIGLINADFSFVNEVGNEFAKVYHLGNANYALDYPESSDPAELLLAFMAIMIRSEEVKRNHSFSRQGSKSGLPLDGVKDVIAGIKDIL